MCSGVSLSAAPCRGPRPAVRPAVLLVVSLERS